MNRTEQLIEDAFSELLEEMPYNKITVKSIIERCGINRNTFYYHYEGIPELTVHMVSSKIDEIIRRQGPSGEPLDYFLPLIDYMREKKKALLHVYESVEREALQNELRKLCRFSFQDFVRQFSAERNLTPEDSSVLLMFCQSAFLGVLLDWLDHKLNYDLESILIHLDRLLHRRTDSDSRQDGGSDGSSSQ